MVLAPHKSVRPVAIVPKRQVINDGRCGAMTFQIRLELLGAFDVTVRNLQRQVLRRVPGNTTTVGIETGPVEIVTIFVRFAASENAAFDFDIAPNKTARGDAKSNMRGILPMMTKRRVGIIHCRNAMHESRRTERWFARITEIQICA